MEGLRGEREKGRKREAHTSGGFSGEAPIGDMSPGAPRLVLRGLFTHTGKGSLCPCSRATA